MISDHVLFSAEMDSIQPIMEWLHEKILLAELTIEDTRKIEVAAEEAIVNVIYYAYPKEKDPPGIIELHADIFPQHKIVLTIKDSGVAFNPMTNKKVINPGQKLEDRAEGGLGILFMRKNVDEMHYRREGPWNVLTLIKKAN